jgi:hypothetical protein
MYKPAPELSDPTQAAILSSIDPDAAGEILEFEERIEDSPKDDRRIIARFSLPAQGEAQLIDVSQRERMPNVALVFHKPHISRGRSPMGTILSPYELFLAFRGSEPVPDILLRHHERLARLGVFDARPRKLPTPLWGTPDPDLPPAFGPNDLCAGSFPADWAWFSMGHGVNNQHTAIQLWTGWSVLTGVSPPRSAALCLTKGEDASALARYDILNRLEGSPWITLYESNLMGPGEGVGFQVYGPDAGQTRIRLTTENDDRRVFWAGASWGIPQDWLSPL